jgi:glutamate-1-semialdehyde 2,1-aminomutase
MATFDRSRRLMAAASRRLPGGVNSNYRLGISPTPLVVSHAEGPFVHDVDGNRLIDYYLGMGPMILGHRPPEVVAAVREQLDRGILYAAQSEIEFEAAELVCEMVPCAEMVRFGGSGTEVIQAALRLARASTGRSVVLKFEGHYHGWLDNVLVSVNPALELAGPRVAPLTVAMTPGQDPAAFRHVEVLPWNDIGLLEARLRQGDVAAVITEPVMFNTAGIFPRDGYLQSMRRLCDETGTVLVFDEVITGFRVSQGGAQQRLGVTPDLATFGKAIANGFPVAALAGRAALMEQFASRRVMHGGTYNAGPLVMAATVATLRRLRDGDVYATIERNGQRLMDGIARTLDAAGLRYLIQGFPQIFNLALGTQGPIHDYRSALAADRNAYLRLTTGLLARGVRVLERGAWFLSSMHDESIVEETLAAVESVAREL